MLNNISKSNITRNIKKLKQEKGIFQDWFLKLADISYTTIIKIESSGNKNPTIEALLKIVKVLDVSVNYLIK